MLTSRLAKPGSVLKACEAGVLVSTRWRDAMVLLQLQPGHLRAVDLVGAVGEAKGTGARPEIGEGEVVGDAGAAVGLYRPVEDAQGDVRGDDLYHGDLGAGFLAPD